MQIKQYELGSKIQEDGLGVLYNANNVETAERAYLKVLNPCHLDDPELVQSFHRCADHCCSIENKSQLQTLAHGQEGDWHYIALEYANFRPLEQVMANHHLVSVMDCLSFVERLAVNLRTYHLEGLVHAHLSPKNIFVDGALREIKIADFGFGPLVRLLLHKKEKFLSASRPFFAPEMSSISEPIERQADIFSIGVLLYQLLMKQMPGKNFSLSGEAEEQNVIIPPSLQRLEIPESVDHLVLSTLELEVQKRCRNLSHFINRLYEAKSEVMEAAGTLTSSKPALQNTTQSEKLAGVPEASETASAGPEADPPSDVGKQDELDADVTKEKSERDFSDADRRKISSDSHSDPEKVISPRGGAFPDYLSTAATVDSKAASSDFHPQRERENSLTENSAEHAPDSGQREDGPRSRTRPSNSSSVEENRLNSDHGDSHTTSHNGSPGADRAANTYDFDDEFSQSFRSLDDLQYDTYPPEGPTDALNGKREKTANISARPHVAPTRHSGSNGAEGSHAAEESEGHSDDYRNADTQTQLANVFDEESKISEDRNETEYHESAISPDITSEFDDIDEGDLLGYTADLSTTDTINVVHPQLGHPSRWAKTRMLLLAALPFIAIVGLAVMAYRYDWFSSANNSASLPAAHLDSPASIESLNTTEPGAERGLSELQPESELIASKGIDMRPNAPSKSRAASSSGVTNDRPARTDIVKKSLASSEKLPSRSRLNDETVVSATPKTTDPGPAPSSALLRLNIRHANAPKRADVYLDGKFVGRADMNGLFTIPKLKLRKAYLVRVERNGYEMWAKEISLSKVGINNLSVDLRSLAPLPDVKEERASRPALTQKGRITVTLANPEEVRYAFIYVNGRLWKENIAPAQLELAAGRYVIEVKKEGFVTDPPVYSVTLGGGEQRSARFLLTQGGE